MKAANAAQMRDIDKHAGDTYGIPGIVLMENAALRVVETVQARFSPLAGKRIAVVCGKGNNGGDGLAAARHLHARFGAAVAVYLCAPAADLTGDAATNFRMAQAFGVDIRPGDRGLDLSSADVVIDALLGTGAKGQPAGAIAAAIQAINTSGRPVVSVDMPSGVDADTGQAPGACVQAAVTVTFGVPKVGLLLYPGAGFAGELQTVDIGLPLALTASDALCVNVTGAVDAARWLPARPEGRDSNKGAFGHAVVFAGSRGFIGAAVLCAEGSARMGAGLTTLCVPESAQNGVVCRVNPTVMTRGLTETAAGGFGPDAVSAALETAKQGTAAAIGPGLGRQAGDFVRQFAAQCLVPLVIDADALNILAEGGADALKSRPAPTVLTPHPGEMGRLLGRSTGDVQADRRGAVEEAARRFRCVALLKGSRTLIASPDGALWVNTTGNAGMASGGMGDALTGIVAALLACGLTAGDAAAAGAYLHGLAGDIVAERWGGKAGLLATDVIDAVPLALARCQNGGL